MKTFILPILIFLFSLNINAQKNRERIQALKVSFITERLDLSEQEAQLFWPIYNNYNKVTRKIKHQDIRNIRHEIKNNANTLTDKKAKEILDKLNKAETSLHKHRIELSNKLLKVIPPRKIILLKMAEEDFKRKILERLRNNRHSKK